MCASFAQGKNRKLSSLTDKFLYINFIFNFVSACHPFLDNN